MDRGLDIEDSDAFFNMRGKFWIESRDKALAEKERNKPFSEKSQEGWELGQNIEGEKRYTVNTHPATARTVSSG